jgi:hypothetical protein
MSIVPAQVCRLARFSIGRLIHHAMAVNPGAIYSLKFVDAM